MTITLYRFMRGQTILASITGAALEIQTYGHDQVTLDVLGPSGSMVDFNSVVLSSGQNAFEFADLQALGAVTGSFAGTPLPSTWAMLIAGLVGLGFFGHRGSKKLRLPWQPPDPKHLVGIRRDRLDQAEIGEYNLRCGIKPYGREAQQALELSFHTA